MTGPNLKTDDIGATVPTLRTEAALLSYEYLTTKF